MTHEMTYIFVDLQINDWDLSRIQDHVLDLPSTYIRVVTSFNSWLMWKRNRVSILILILGNHRFQNYWKGTHVKMESE